MTTLLLPWVVLLVAGVEGQGPSFYYPQQPQPPQSAGPRQEVLGNYFNDNVNLPSITTSQPTFSSPQPQTQFQYQPQTFTNGPSQTFGGFTNQNYITSPPGPAVSNIPRQTSFFGNNYDFFRQFHSDAAPQRPSSFHAQPFNRPPQPSFSSNGNSLTSTTVPASSSASPSFTSTQFFGGPFPTTPTRPAPPTIYNFHNGPPAPNSIFNGYDDAAKALGVTHGLRVFTTQTLTAKPTISVTLQDSQETIPKALSTPSAPENDKRIEDEDLTLTPSSTLPPPQPSPTSTFPSTTTPDPVVIKYTGRSIAAPVVRSRVISSVPTSVSSTTVATPVSTPKVVVVSHSRQPLYSATGVDAFPGRAEDDFEPLVSQPQRPLVNQTPTQRPVAPQPQPERHQIVTTRLPPSPQPQPERHQIVTTRLPPSPPPHNERHQIVSTRLPPSPQPQPERHQTVTTRLPPSPPPQPIQTTRFRIHQPPPPPPPPTYSAEKPLYNSANRLNPPGRLYSNTNGAYQAYYGPGTTGGVSGGLEEIEPQIIDFNVPMQKMIALLEQQEPVRSEEYDPYQRPLSFNTFGPPFSQPPRPQPPPRPFNSLSVSPSPPQFIRPSPQSPIAVIVTEAAPSQTAVTKDEVPTEVIRVGPKGRLLKKRRKAKSQQQRTAAATLLTTTTAEARPTTYRPPVQSDEDEDRDQPSTTYRSRFRFSTTSTTTPPPPPSSGGASPSSDGGGGDKTLIQSRLKSLERQIRFRHRNKNS